MPQVDEFGRAIPGGAAEETGAGTGNSVNYYGSALPTARSHRDDRSLSSGGGGSYQTRGGLEERSFHRDNDNRSGGYFHQNHREEYRDNSRGRGGGRYNDFRQPPPPPPPHSQYNNNNPPYNSSGGHHQSSDRTIREGPPSWKSIGGSSSGRRPLPSSTAKADASIPISLAPPPHPSQRYVTEPMLCEFLWKEQQQNERSDKEGGEEADGINGTSSQESSRGRIEEDVGGPPEQLGQGSKENEHQRPPEEVKGVNEIEKDVKGKTYDEYRLEYAWIFLKHFFNQHLDDSWFRQHFSPALLVEQARLERRRCHLEAALMRQTLLATDSNYNLTKEMILSKVSLTVQSNAAANGLESSSFTAMTQQQPSNSTPPKIPEQHLCSSFQRTLHIHNVPPHVTDEHLRQSLLPLMTDYYQEEMDKKGRSSSNDAKKKKSNVSSQEVLENCLFGIFSSTPNNSNKNSSSSIAGYGGGGGTIGTLAPPPRAASGGRGGSAFLNRSVFCVCTTREVCDGVWQVLIQRTANPGAEDGSQPNSASNAKDDPNLKNASTNSHKNNNEKPSSGGAPDAPHVPRKHETAHLNSFYHDLEVDCTDPYGRTEYDANGQGAAPPDGLAIPPRKAVVPISRYANTTMNQITGSAISLSAALSSPGRFESDQEAAKSIARALDIRHHVPQEDRLETILESVLQKIPDAAGTTSLSTAGKTETPSNLFLDIALAYLRRVHLYSFYKTSKAETFGDVLAGSAVAAQVQLREEVEPEFAEADKEDLLAQRLDDSIRQALDVDCNEWIAGAGWYVDEATDKAADEIHELEEQATQAWVSNHAMDDDGRARCSFHFCHKLFKDESFLAKHLLKKHHAYNEAERAKCHDTFMMSIWEKAPLRPGVPSVLVDCGKQFGKVESLLCGGAEPRATDPEPALWERKQQQDKLRMERSELRATRHRPEYDRKKDPQQSSSMLSPYNNNSSNATPRSGGARSFVDVDDMKDETVEVSFDQVQVPVPDATKKKKKKKRKLL